MSAVELEGWSTVQSQAGFSTGYWTLCVLTSCTVFSKILEPVNTSSQARAPVNPDVATLTLNISEATTGCIRPFSPISSFPSPPAPYCLPHPLPPSVGPLGLEAESESLLRQPPSSSCRTDVLLLTGPPVLGAHPCVLSFLSQQARPLSPAFSLPLSQCPSEILNT